MRALGAELIVRGRDFDDAGAHAATLVASDERAHIVSSYHRDFVVGVATYARELFAAGEFDVDHRPYLARGQYLQGVIGGEVSDLISKAVDSATAAATSGRCGSRTR